MLRVPLELHSKTVITVERIYQILTERFRLENQSLVYRGPRNDCFLGDYIAKGSYHFLSEQNKSDFLSCQKMYL